MASANSILWSRSRVGDDRESTLTQIGYSLSVRVAVHVEEDVGELLQKGLQFFSPSQLFWFRVVLKERVVVDEDDLVFFRNVSKSLFKLFFRFWRKVAIRREDGGGKGRVK